MVGQVGQVCSGHGVACRVGGCLPVCTPERGVLRAGTCTRDGAGPPTPPAHPPMSSVMLAATLGAANTVGTAAGASTSLDFLLGAWAVGRVTVGAAGEGGCERCTASTGAGPAAGTGPTGRGGCDVIAPQAPAVAKQLT